MKVRPYQGFWKVASVLLLQKRKLAATLLAAFCSAAFFGISLSLAYPALHLLLRDPAPGSPRAMDPAGITGFLPRLMSDFFSSSADPFASFVRLMALVVILGLLGSCSRYAHERCSIYIVSEGVRIWRDRLASRLMLAPVPAMQRLGVADNLSRLVSDTAVLFTGFKAIAGAPVLELLKGLAALITALVVDWRISSIALVVTPLMIRSVSRGNLSVRQASHNARRQWSRLVSTLQHALLAIHVVKLHHAEQIEERRLSDINRQVLQEERGIGNARALGSLAVEVIAVCSIAVLTVLAGWLIFRKNVEPARFITVVAALMAAAQGLKPLTRLSQEIAESDAAAARLLEVMQLPAEFDHHAAGKVPVPRHQLTIEFDSVAFRYPGRQRPALRDFTLTVPHGSMVALVGGNGSGKTTLMSMIPRLLEPDSGRVLLDGIDIAHADLHALRRQIALVPQENALFPISVTENIAYGLCGVSREKIEEAARAAYADEFIRELPFGYDTELGEFGAGLSSGQKQRIAIARAILRDPAILILDEATSQIDSESELKIGRVIQRLRGERTIFVSSHQRGLMVHADLVVVMEGGEIVDIISHQGVTAQYQ